jgi:hypothetical protein
MLSVGRLNAVVLCEVILDSPTQIKLIVGARLRLRAPGCPTKEPPPGTLMPTTTRIRSEAGDENQSPIHFPELLARYSPSSLESMRHIRQPYPYM